MIIQILSNLCEEGYLKKEGYGFTSPFFSGANVAYRRGVFEQIGLYDKDCATGEDHDICLRTANTAWDLYFQPKAVVRHNNRGTFRRFVRRWLNYGLKHPYVFKKHTPKSLRLYLISRRPKKGDLYRCIFNGKWLPFRAVVFVTPFLAMHILLVITIALVLLGLVIPWLVLGSITLVTAISYFKSDVDRKHPGRTILFAALRYAANMALLLGSLIGALRLKMIYVSGTLDNKP